MSDLQRFHRAQDGVMDRVRSSMTLFHRVSGDPLFASVLDALYEGETDRATLAILESWDRSQ